MNTKCRLALFDFDGTVFDTVEGITKCVRYAINKVGIDAPLDELRCFAGPPLGDMFITVTGCSGVITAEHFETMKDGAILTNAGHFDVEVDMAGLRALAVRTYDARHNIQGYVLPSGKTIFTIAEGRLVNLAAGDGHPAEIMDMSFAIQALSCQYLAKHAKELVPGVIPVSRELDEDVAYRKLRAMNVEIDYLTKAQEDYLGK